MRRPSRQPTRDPTTSRPSRQCSTNGPTPASQSSTPAPQLPVADAIKLAVDQALSAVGSSTAPPQERQWTIQGWVQSVDDVNRLVADALSRPLQDHAADGDVQLAFMRSLAQHGSAKALEHVLADVGGRLVASIAESLWNAMGPLRDGGALTAESLHEKFVQKENSYELEYGTLESFFGGLERMLGPPNTNLMSAMTREHTQSANSEKPFSASNYHTETCPLYEWWFVTDPAEGLKKLKGRIYEYPQEYRDVQRRRVPLPPSSFSGIRRNFNKQLASLNEEPLKLEEFIAARLYTGPMYTLYNKVLRAIGKETKRKQLMELTLGEHYVTTLHVVNSAVVKMGKVQKATKVYRGIKGGVLPAEFWTANDLGVRGGVERGFMSTTLDRDVALSYATGGSSGMVFEVQMGMVDRGADCSWLSTQTSMRSSSHPSLESRLSIRALRVRCSSSRYGSTSTSQRSPLSRWSPRCAIPTCTSWICSATSSDSLGPPRTSSNFGKTQGMRQRHATTSGSMLERTSCGPRRMRSTCALVRSKS